MKRKIKIWIDVSMTCFLLFQMSLAFLAVLFLAGAMISGFSMARDLFPVVPFRLRGSTARELHMVSVYWGFVILFLHLGLHWSMMLGMMKKKVPALQNMFVFFDFEEPLVFFILDYLAVMGLFAWVGYYIAEWLKRFSIRKIKESINRRKSL